MATNTLQATISAAAFGTVFWQVVRRYGVRSTSTLLFGFGGIVTLLFLLLDSHEVYAQYNRWLEYRNEQEQEEQEQECSLCGERTSSGMSCTGSSSSPHHFCADCLNNYASTSFQHGECYSREQHSSNSLISKRGQLPCPYFTSHQCSCNELNIFSLIGIVTPDVQEQWKQALGRLAVIADGEAAKKANDQKTIAIARNSPLDLLVAAVAEILVVGAHIACPRCNLRGEKDDACMHISCSGCGCRFCYCCGRERGAARPNQCSTCDSNSLYLENHAAFHGHQQGSESAGFGALHEFHRRRMSFFLRKLKLALPSQDLWRQLRCSYPGILNDIPTPGRRIEWTEIDKARTPPLFGRTATTGLRWYNDAQPIIDNLLKQLKQHGNGKLIPQSHRPTQAVAKRASGVQQTRPGPPAVRLNASSAVADTRDDDFEAMVHDIITQGGQESEELLRHVLATR